LEGARAGGPRATGQTRGDGMRPSRTRPGSGPLARHGTISRAAHVPNSAAGNRRNSQRRRPGGGAHRYRKEQAGNGTDVRRPLPRRRQEKGGPGRDAPAGGKKRCKRNHVPGTMVKLAEATGPAPDGPTPGRKGPNIFTAGKQSRGQKGGQLASRKARRRSNCDPRSKATSATKQH